MPSSKGGSPFDIRGAIEGFYGTFYTFPERLDLIKFLGRHDFNLYVYAPKNDRQHRMRWWDPYPENVLDDFAGAIDLAWREGVTFCYGISFGTPIDYASSEHFEIVTQKLEGFYARGCRAFAVLVDDLCEERLHGIGSHSYESIAQAQTDFANRLHSWSGTLGEKCALYFCPSEYSGRPPFGQYLTDVGRYLDREIEVFYTGPDVTSRHITVADLNAFAEVVGRAPVVWDNYPTNDLTMRPALHIGPLQGRDPELYRACRGFVSNLMNEKEASKVPLLTIADYLHDPEQYEPWSAWENALAQALDEADRESFRVFAETSLASPLAEIQAPAMDALVGNVMAVLGEAQPGSSPQVKALSEYLDLLDESCYGLKNRMRNHALRANILPWIDALDELFWMGRSAVRTLRAIDAGIDCSAALGSMEEHSQSVARNPKRIGGLSLLDLVEQVRIRARDAVPLLSGKGQGETGAVTRSESLLNTTGGGRAAQ